MRELGKFLTDLQREADRYPRAEDKLTEASSSRSPPYAVTRCSIGCSKANPKLFCPI